MRIFKGFLLIAIMGLITYYGFFTNNKTYADWILDQIPPTVSNLSVENSAGDSKTCVTNTAPSDFPLKVTATIIDPAVPASGIAACGGKLNGTTILTGSLSDPINNTLPTINPNQNSQATCTLNIITPANMAATNTVTVTGTDWAGNSGSADTPTFYYSTNCTPGPWIQTTGGDVHTNESINIPQ